MAPRNDEYHLDDRDSKIIVENLEDVSYPEHSLTQFPLLREKSPTELEHLDKAVLKKLDYYFLPCVTVMLLMRCVCYHCHQQYQTLMMAQLPRQNQRIQRPSSRHAGRPPHVRHRMVRRHFPLLCGIHHLSSSGKRLHRQRQTKHNLPLHYALLVCRHSLHAGPYLRLGLLSMSIPRRRDRRPLYPRGLLDDFILVHEERIPLTHGHLARREYHL